MTTSNANLRRAAILIRSLDADAAAKLLGQLSTAEAKSLRLAMQSLGSVAADERAEVLAAFQQGKVLPEPKVAGGVELELSHDLPVEVPGSLPEVRPRTNPSSFSNTPESNH